MAKILGASQAWQAVTERLGTRRLRAESVSDIRKMLVSKAAEYEIAKAQETKRFDDELENLVNELESRRVSLEADLVKREYYIDLDVEFFEIAILLLQNKTWIVQKILNKSKIQKHKAHVQRLKAKKKKIRWQLTNDITTLETAIKNKRDHKDSIIEDGCSSIKKDVELLKKTISSPELAGAEAELEIIEQLKKLPDNYYVVSGITLILDKAKRLDGQWLKSAQIDHLVIAPAGVFVIEAKNWSKEFSEHGSYFDPYQQVKRASHVCYMILKDPASKLKTKSMIVHKGAIPEKPEGSYTKVLRIEEMNNYILWHKESILSDAEIKEAISLLRVWSQEEF